MYVQIILRESKKGNLFRLPNPFSHRSTACIVSHKAFPPRIKSYDECLTLLSLGSWNDISSCLFITSSPWQCWQGHPYCWHFPPPSPHCHPRLLWLGSPANVAIYKNSWDSSADKAFLNRHYRFNRHPQSRGGAHKLSVCLWEGGRAAEHRAASLCANLHTIPRLALDAEHVCQTHQQLGPWP